MRSESIADTRPLGGGLEHLSTVENHSCERIDAFFRVAIFDVLHKEDDDRLGAVQIPHACYEPSRAALDSSSV
eukprot:779564-Amorphochlora_amoeboformis.AAC.1